MQTGNCSQVSSTVQNISISKTNQHRYYKGKLLRGCTVPFTISSNNHNAHLDRGKENMMCEQEGKSIQIFMI